MFLLVQAFRKNTVSKGTRLEYGDRYSTLRQTQFSA